MRLIDADALLKRVWSEEIQAQAHGREFSTCFMSPGGTPSTEWWYVEDLIENAPTIEPERKKGKWELIDDTEFRIPGYRCSVCHCECEDWENKPTYNFCPNCGSYNGGIS